jgi:predicted RNA binding protein YcfA (HicA-like mRNA interferase family)
MASLKSKDFAHALEKKGFKKSAHTKQRGRRGRGNHHIYYYFFYKGKQTKVKTRISHGNKEYDDKVISDIKKEMYLDKNELFDFVRCKLTESKYTAILLQRKVLKSN